MTDPKPPRAQNMIGRVVHEEGTGRLRGQTRCGVPIGTTWVRLSAEQKDDDGRPFVLCTECWPKAPPP